jgi:hypothetical protein
MLVPRNTFHEAGCCAQLVMSVRTAWSNVWSTESAKSGLVLSGPCDGMRLSWSNYAIQYPGHAATSRAADAHALYNSFMRFKLSGGA